MKFFKKYYLVLPPVALLYGIYILNMKFTDKIPVYLMDSWVNGWALIGILFAALEARVIYQLQQNKKQQYIYSLPWTKKEIYKKSVSGLHISFLIAEIIYGICFTIKTASILRTEPIQRMILCTLLNITFWFAVCAITELALFATAYVWQGLIVTLAAVFVLIPMIIQNIVFLFQMLFKTKLVIPKLLRWIIYSQYPGDNILYPIKYLGDVQSLQEVIGNVHRIDMQYVNVSIFCMIVFILAGVLALWYAKRQYTRCDQAQNRMLTRLSEMGNRVILTIVIGVGVFNTVTNMEMYHKLVITKNTIGRRVYLMIMWNKNYMGYSERSKELLHLLSGSHVLIYFIASFVITYLVVTLFQTIRRKHYERAC